MDKFEYINCNLCGNSSHKVIFKARYDLEKDKDYAVKFRSSGDELLIDQVVRCNNCGFIYVNPRLKSEIILDSYAAGEDKVFVSQVNSRENTFRKYLKKIEKFRLPPGRILDIGTAGGSFLHTAKQRGWEVYGCEPNRWLCDWGNKHYGIKIMPGTVFEQNYDSAFFDVITLWDVLEHTPDPKKVLMECRRIIKKDGLLIVNYPDIGSWIARVMGRKWVFLLSGHLFYFTYQTMKIILRDTGFSVLKADPHFQELTLGYIFKRSKAHLGIIGSIGQLMSKCFGLSNVNTPYWIGQTLVIAKKN